MSAIDLVVLNVWLDVVFFGLYAVVLVALLGVHLTGNFLTGRFRKRFKDWEWPHHEGPPVPFLPKFLHFQHVASMIILALSGMYIRFIDHFPGQASWARDFLQVLHYVAMIVVTVNLVWRLWYAFAARQRDYREFAITKQDIVTAPKVVMYYAFIKKSKPHLGKYNVMQKGTYTLFAPLLIVQAFTGFALLGFWEVPFTGLTPSQILLGWWLGADFMLGSTALAVAWTRVAHYIINWLFIILTTVHVYLSVTEDFPAFLNFFGLSFLDRGHADHGDEAHGHGHGHGHDDEGGHGQGGEHAGSGGHGVEPALGHPD